MGHLTPKEFAQAGTVGLLFCEDEDGKHVTLATDDLDYYRMLTTSEHSVRAGLTISADKFPTARPGWPDEWDERYPSLEALGDEIAAVIAAVREGAP
jgi:hypothetical protein